MAKKINLQQANVFFSSTASQLLFLYHVKEVTGLTRILSEIFIKTKIRHKLFHTNLVTSNKKVSYKVKIEENASVVQLVLQELKCS